MRSGLKRSTNVWSWFRESVSVCTAYWCANPSSNPSRPSSPCFLALYRDHLLQLFLFYFNCVIDIPILLLYTLCVCFLQQFFSIWNNIAFASAFLPLRFLARYANVSIIVGPTVLCRRLFIVTFFLPNTNRCSHLPIYTHRAISIRFRILNSRRHM